MIVYICDDNKTDRKIISEEVLACIERRGLDASVETFDSVDAVLEGVRVNKPDALLLDIDMPGIDGLELAGIISSSFVQVNVIFVSNRVDMVFESIKFRPYRFIPKENIHEKLDEAITSLANKLDGDKKMLRITDDITITPLEIIYVESFRHYILIHQTNGEIRKVRGKLSEYIEPLRGAGFIRVNVSYLVNVRCVVKIYSGKLRMINEQEISISRGKENEVKQSYINARREFIDGIIR